MRKRKEPSRRSKEKGRPSFFLIPKPSEVELMKMTKEQREEAIKKHKDSEIWMVHSND